MVSVGLSYYDKRTACHDVTSPTFKQLNKFEQLNNKRLKIITQ